MALLLAKEFRSEIVLIHAIPEIAGLKIDRDEMTRIATGKLRELKTDRERKGAPR